MSDQLHELIAKVIEAGNVLAHSTLWPPLKGDAYSWDVAKAELEAALAASEPRQAECDCVMCNEDRDRALSEPATPKQEEGAK